VQNSGTREPIVVAVVDAAAQAMRRNTGYILPTLKLCIHKIVTAVDAPYTPPDFSDVILSSELDAIERRIALLEGDKIEIFVGEIGPRSARREILQATDILQRSIDETLIARIKSGRVETERPLSARQSGLDRERLFLFEIGVSYLEGSRRFVNSFREQFSRIRRSLHMVPR